MYLLKYLGQFSEKIPNTRLKGNTEAKLMQFVIFWLQDEIVT